MKQLLLTTGISLGICLASVAAYAGERVDQSLDAAADGDVVIEHLNGEASIIGWDNNQVKVTGELGDNTDKFVFERNGNEVLIKVKVKRHNKGWSWGGDHDEGDKLQIYVPNNSRLSYSSTNADVSVTKVYGGADVDVVNGDMDVQQLKGKINLESVNGDIETNNLVGSVKIGTVNGSIEDKDTSGQTAHYRTVNGSIEAKTDASDIKAESVNGDIDLVLSKVEELDLKTVNGSLAANLQLAAKGDVRASSVSGTVSLFFTKEVSARFDIEGHAGGRISNKLSDHKEQKDKYGASRWLKFSLNGGDAKVDVATVSGRVKLAYQ